MLGISAHPPTDGPDVRAVPRPSVSWSPSPSLPHRLDQSIGKPSLFISVSGGFLHRDTLGVAAQAAPSYHPSTHACLFHHQKVHVWQGNPERGAGRPTLGKLASDMIYKGFSASARTCMRPHKWQAFLGYGCECGNVTRTLGRWGPGSGVGGVSSQLERWGARWVPPSSSEARPHVLRRGARGSHQGGQGQASSSGLP